MGQMETREVYQQKVLNWDNPEFNCLFILIILLSMSTAEQNEEKAKVYDRQSFIGYLAQKRLLESNVLIVGLNGCMAELAKNMILAGANLTLVDAAAIDATDAESNFLFTAQEIGKQRLDVGYDKLREINPLVRIEKSTLEQATSDLAPYNIVATSTKSFQELADWDAKTKQFNKPYYNLVCCGLYGFCYISLGTSFVYEREKRQTISFTFGQKYDKPKFKQFEEVTAHSLPFRDALTENYKLTENYSANYIYHCILMMHKAQEQGIQDLEKQVQLGADLYKQIYAKDPSQELLSLMKQHILLITLPRDFARLYGIDFCPVYSVIGSVASQEMIITISRQNQPANNWFCYSSVKGVGKIECLQDESKFDRKDTRQQPLD